MTSSALFQAFQEVAERYSSEPAMVDDAGCLSYGQALAQIQILAQHIRSSGKSAVLIRGPKSRWTVLWQLACAKAGQVFVPTAPTDPEERIATVCKEVSPRFIVDTGPIEARAGIRGTDANLITTEQWAVSECSAWAEYANEVSHIVMSSGSTGRPKVILLPAAPVVEVVTAQAEKLVLSPGARFAWLLNPAFDASLSDCYATLLAGATLYISNIPLSAVKRTTQFLADRAITHTDIPPSLLPIINPDHLPNLKVVVFGGELSSLAAINRWWLSGKRMLNAYGPTEATICTHMCEVTESWHATDIGQALKGVECWVLTPKGLAPLTESLEGELLIAGAHLACQYLEESLTASKFQQHAGLRMYHTGDLIRVTSQGVIHFKGRVDRQLKRRGVLICPEEIETLARKAGCSEAFVKQTHNTLTLHYVSKDLDGPALRQMLTKHLPATFVPQHYVKHESLPKTASGKVSC